MSESKSYISSEAIKFLPIFYHKKKKRGASVWSLASRFDLILSLFLIPNYWKHKNDIPDVDRILKLLGVFF